MNDNDVRQYVGLPVLIELKNGLRVTATIPEFEGNSFTVIDKFNKRVSIECDLIFMVYEQ